MKACEHAKYPDVTFREVWFKKKDIKMINISVFALGCSNQNTDWLLKFNRKRKGRCSKGGL